MWSNQSLMTNIPSSALARSDRVGTEELKSGCVDGGICASSMLGGIYVSLTRGREPEKASVMSCYRFRPPSECLPTLNNSDCDMIVLRKNLAQCLSEHTVAGPCGLFWACDEVQGGPTLLGLRPGNINPSVFLVSKFKGNAREAIWVQTGGLVGFRRLTPGLNLESFGFDSQKRVSSPN